MSLESLDEGWKRALDVLENLSHVSAAAKRCLAAVQLLNGDTTKNETGNGGLSARGDDSLLENSRLQGPGAVSLLRSPVLLQTLPGTVETAFPVDDTFAAFAGQDFSWLDSLPVDLISADYAELSEYAEY